MINIENIVRDSVNKLWSEFSNEEFCKYSPHSIAEVPEEGLIFIGLNPSMIEKVRLRLVEKNDINCEFHKLNSDVDKEYRYFKKFFEVGETTNLKWGHIDVLFNRETNQGRVKSLISSVRGKQFIERQCKITRQVLDELIDENRPRIFVVTNSFARELLGTFRAEEEESKANASWIGLDFVWNESLGTYFYKNNPFFFSSMLTGQRALDNGSFKRLVWHINQVKKSVCQ
ncbi:hypothetical protein [Flavobacterium frigidarium]|uniref:hypothetical protein n=1 Tax=Flavobacterium frigidarium TaxID=99286 RepID=UPI00041774EB|nr:hypothetical protein [Flavobacterium frigidarium]